MCERKINTKREWKKDFLDEKLRSIMPIKKKDPMYFWNQITRLTSNLTGCYLHIKAFASLSYQIFPKNQIGYNRVFTVYSQTLIST
jgi:hypothetical protein